MPDRPTFYADRCLGKAVPRALRAAGAQIEIHDDHFVQDAADEDWISEVSSRGWIILTKDKNIRRPGGEREAVLKANARVITLSSGNMLRDDIIALFVGRLAEMEQLAADRSPPFVAILGPGGIEIVIPPPSSAPPGEEGETK